MHSHVVFYYFIFVMVIYDVDQYGNAILIIITHINYSAHVVRAAASPCRIVVSHVVDVMLQT